MSSKSMLERFNLAQDNMVVQYNELALSTLSGMVDSNIIDVAPHFQRRDRWDPTKQSLLIESFLLNLPVPPVYLAEDASGTFSVIDGRQRLTAVTAFLSDNLRLTSLIEFPELDGSRYSELPAAMRASLQMRPLRSVTLMRQTDPELKYLVFHRLNSAGEVLNAQEIRNVIYRGPLNDLLHELSADNFLRQQLKIRSDESSAYRKMQDVEYVLRFLTLEETWEKFSGDLSWSMDQFMEDHQHADRETLTRMRDAFIAALRACEDLFGTLAFNRPEGSGWRDQSLAGLFDAEMLAVHLMKPASLTRIKRHPNEALQAVRQLFENRDFENSVRVATNTPSRVRLRIAAMRDALEGVTRE